MKYVETFIALQEFPDEVTLAINISNCPFRCQGCHSPWLWTDVGHTLSAATLDVLIGYNKGISCVAFMGGDGALDEVLKLARHVRGKHPGLKIGMYSGRSLLRDLSLLLPILDYVKVGPYLKDRGGLDSVTTNQAFYSVEHTEDGGYSLRNMTFRFQGR